jgi:hypothetical protein
MRNSPSTERHRADRQMVTRDYARWRGRMMLLGGSMPTTKTWHGSRVSDVEAALTHIVRVTLESHGREVGAKALMRKPFERDLLIGVLEAVITAA